MQLIGLHDKERTMPFVTGQLNEALASQRKAVELAGDEADDEVKARLEQYEKAVNDKP